MFDQNLNLNKTPRKEFTLNQTDINQNLQCAVTLLSFNIDGSQKDIK